jgi:hypothetical protein
MALCTESLLISPRYVHSPIVDLFLSISGGKKLNFTFTTDSCIEGISLKGCFKGPCDSPDEIDKDDIPVRDDSVKL